MKFNKIIAIFFVLLAVAALLCACSKDKGGEETTTSGEVTTEAATEPRFDYFGGDMSEYLSIDPADYSELVIELEDTFTLDESEVDKRVEKLLISNKTALNDGAKVTNAALKKGDSAFIFYKGVINGEEFEGGSNMGDDAPMELSLGSGTFIDGFEDGLVGVVPSETSIENPKVLNLTFPENYGYAELAGKDVTFYVYVAWAVQYTVPEYDAEFITDVLKWTTEEEDIVAAHRKYLAEQLSASLDTAKSNAIETTIWEILHANATVIKYPEGEVEFYYEAYLDEIEYLMNYYGYMGYTFSSLDEFAISYLGLEKGTDWKAELKRNAENAVAQKLIIHVIADQQGLSVTDAEYEAEIQANIDYYKANGQTYTREEVIDLAGEDMMKEAVLYDKVVGFIKERMTVNLIAPKDDAEEDTNAGEDTEVSTEKTTEAPTEEPTEETTEATEQ